MKLKALRNIFGQLIWLSIQHNIDFKKLPQYPLSQVPWSLNTPDGLPLKIPSLYFYINLKEMIFWNLNTCHIMNTHRL